MTDKIRFSQFVIDKLDAGDFTAQRDSYTGAHFGFKNPRGSMEENEGRDIWELWTRKRWFGKPPFVGLTRRGRYLDYLTDDEKRALHAAVERATILATQWEAEAKERARQKREANHWWP